MGWDSLLLRYYSKLGLALSKSFALYVEGALSCCSSSTQQIARQVSSSTGKAFNTCEKGLSYLLSNQNFQIDDAFWRMHIRMVFDLMKEQNLLPYNDKIPIQVDFTFNKDYFLILTASIIVGDRAVPIYMTMRNYPKRAGSYDHKKMEGAFLRGLKHILSTKYQYVIVADRGFGHARFTGICDALGFEYVVRVQPNMRVICEGEDALMSNLFHESGAILAYVKPWQRQVRLIRHQSQGSCWYIATNIKDISMLQGVEYYQNRFKIEKCFQDLKRSGFDIESSKIRKYDRYKRLLVICMVSQALLVFSGYVIRERMPSLLKNSPLSAHAFLAFFQSANMPCAMQTNETSDISS